MIHWDDPKSAAAVAGNWRKFGSFGWDGAFKLPDPDNWFIFYTSNRDSGLLDQSNEAAIDKRLEPLLGDDLAAERHRHWACGYVDGYAVRVLTDREPTAAFIEVCNIQYDLEQHPVLDEEDFSERETEATIENIADNVPSDIDTDLLPDDWADMVYFWLWEHDQGEIECYYPSETAIVNALRGLELL